MANADHSHGSVPSTRRRSSGDHVTSAHSSVFQLMKAYEADGLLSIRPSVRFPFDEKEMLYDPNSQTEFTHQLLLAHECFYEFREVLNLLL
uniref:Glycosyltransferase family 92 protein n=1 Tax=Ditylenchus dipsaci TaxID=166011 RepID=A0A915DZL5_9BILA